ncbi:MAG: class I SAM-dependent methyltransferase [Chloroflexia bacterium]
MTLEERLVAMPRLWNLLRRLLEANFRGEKAVIRRELRAWQQGSRLRLLDLGCGTGELASLFPAEGYVGMDVSEVYVAYARRTYGPRFQVMDGQALAYADNTFDEALVAGVFHHLPDDAVRRMAGELARVLRPAGRLLAMEDVPTRDGWNLPGRLIHRLDRGAHIRNEGEYLALLSEHFALERAYPMRSGFCDYLVLVLRNRKPGAEIP